MLPEGRTVQGRRLVWRNGPLTATDPVAAWNGLLAARGLSEADPFFSPRLSDLPDPFAMVDMDKAAQRVAKIKKEVSTETIGFYLAQALFYCPRLGELKPPASAGSF